MVKPCLLRDERIHEAIMVHGYARTARQEPLSLHPSTLSRITKRIEEELRAGAFLGTDTFVEQMKPLLKEKPVDPKIRKEGRFAARPSLEELFSGVSDKATRNERIHPAVRVHQYTLREVGDFLGLYFSTMSLIAKRATKAKKHQE